MTQDSPVFYDPTTDSLYIKLRPGPSVDNIVHDDREFVIDIGEDGQPVGYDIQFASKHPDVIAEALQILQRGSKIAAE
jgi:uncharacterized protein YuzE